MNQVLVQQPRAARKEAAFGALQRKSVLGVHGDPLEAEADRVAAQVLTGPAPSDVGFVPPAWCIAAKLDKPDRVASLSNMRDVR